MTIHNEYNKRSIGSDYEARAAEYLQSLGMVLLERNYRSKCGEIDLIAKDGNYYVFCEVKFRTTSQYGYPTEAVTAYKQRTIKKVAQYYLLSHHLHQVYTRFDVISILGDRLEHFPNAF